MARSKLSQEKRRKYFALKNWRKKRAKRDEYGRSYYEIEPGVFIK